MAYFRIFILQKNINLFFGSTFGSLRGRRSGGKGLLLPRPPFRCSATGWPSAAGYTFGNSHLPQLFCLHQPMNSWRYNHCVRSRSIFVSIMWRFQSVQPINVELVMLFRLKPSNVLDTKLIEAIDRNRFSDNFADTNNTIRLHTLTLIFLSILSTSCPNVSMICSPWSIKNLSSSSGVWISRTS